MCLLRRRSTFSTLDRETTEAYWEGLKKDHAFRKDDGAKALAEKHSEEKK